MNTLHFLLILGIGAVAGGVASKVTQSGTLGLAGDTIVGVVGAGLAGFLLPRFLPGTGLVGLFIGATIGAIGLLTILRMVKSK